MNNGQTPPSIDSMVTDISGSKAQTQHLTGHDAGDKSEQPIPNDDAGTAGIIAT